MKKLTLRTILTVALALILAVSLAVVGRRQVDYIVGEADYSEAARIASIPELRPIQFPEPGGTAAPDTNLELLAAVDLDSLRAVNQDVRGWIMLPGTTLSYPVVQGTDNQHYLNYTWKNTRSAAGSIFMDYRSSGDFSDFATLIYGHRMNNDSMFGTLRAYQDPEFWKTHPSVYLVRDGGIFRYDIYAVFTTDVTTQVYRLTFPEREDKEEYIAYGLEHSMIDTGIVPTADSEIITLSTCVEWGHSVRWVVQAVLQNI